MTRRTLGLVILWASIFGVLCTLFITRERWAYEPYTAEDYGGSYELTLEKRWRLLPGPRFVERPIDVEQFEELAETAEGGEISTGDGMIFRAAKGEVSTDPLLRRQLFLSERALAELSEGPGTDD